MRYCHFGVSPVNYSDSDSDSKPETKFSVTTNFRNVNLDEKNSIILIADVNLKAIYSKKTQLMHENMKESDVK